MAHIDCQVSNLQLGYGPLFGTNSRVGVTRKLAEEMKKIRLRILHRRPQMRGVGVGWKKGWSGTRAAFAHRVSTMLRALSGDRVVVGEREDLLLDSSLGGVPAIARSELEGKWWQNGMYGAEMERIRCKHRLPG